MQDKLAEYEARAAEFAGANGAAPRVEYVVVDLTPVSHMDSMGAHFFLELIEEYG